MPYYDILKDGFGFFTKKKYKYQYIWQNNSIVNDRIEYKDIKKPEEHKVTFSLNFKTGEFETNSDNQVVEISGHKALIQSIQKFMLTGRDKYEIYTYRYGVSFNLLDAKDEDEFRFMCETVAKEILDFFFEYIVGIVYIKKLRKPKNRIEIGLKFKSDTEIDRIKIDLAEKI